MSRWLHKLPGFQRSAAGLEWVLWRRLPRILVWGTALPVLLAVAAHLWAPEPASDQLARDLQLFDYVTGVVVLHWTLVLTLAIGCVIVMVMKGPAYVADAYPLNDRDTPLDTSDTRLEAELGAALDTSVVNSDARPPKAQPLQPPDQPPHQPPHSG